MNFDYFGRQRKKNQILHPFCRGGIPADLIQKYFAGHPIDSTVTYLFENLLDRLGFLADTQLGLVVGEATQAAGVEVHFHLAHQRIKKGSSTELNPHNATRIDPERD